MKAILLNRILLVLAFVGLYVAGVLSLGHLLDANIPCGGSSDCATVANHAASKFFGVLPVAYLGFLAYVGLAAVAGMRALKSMRNAQSLVTAGFVLAAIGTIFSLYLQYQSFAVIHASCKWCMASAAIMILTLIGHAGLAQLSETESQTAVEPAGLDRNLLIGLPLAVVLALGIQGAMMGAPTETLAAGANKQLGKDVYDKLVAGKVNSIGPENAKLTVIEFADLQCGACQTHSPMVKAFAEQNPKSVRFIYRHFPLGAKHQWSMPAAAISEYAAEKGKFWDFIMAVMGLNRQLEGVEELYGLAKQVGLDENDLKKRMTNPEDPAYKKVVEDMNIADSLGIQMTPTFFIATEGGNKIEVASSRDVLEILQSEKYKKVING